MQPASAGFTRVHQVLGLGLAVSVSELYHLAGSGSTSGNVDPEKTIGKIVINSHKN